ncbi:MAG: DUF2252 domain-containing protein [Gemmatimonadetes bacterium]|nr:DUF2252 domain-containing protein [Gemmatimonadota bacterium]
MRTSHGGHRIAIALLVLGALAFGCGPAGEEAGESRLSEGAAELLVHPDSFDFASNPRLLERVRATPHGYFRFINIPFSRAVCQRLDHLIDTGPLGADRFPFNLHGDAHVEQYAVTDLGRGLTDFDDSSEGPPWVDGMRFAVSIRLAALANGWEDQADGIVSEFVRGYADVVQDSTLSAPVPAVVERYQATFKHDSLAYLAWVDSIMQPLSETERRELLLSLQPYSQLMRATNTGLPEGFFQPVQVGALQLGVGSALDAKYLVRIAGPSVNPADDVIIEMKRVRSLAGIPCIRADDDDPFRVLHGGARIAYRPFRFLGFVEHDGEMFWTHAWVANYRELEVTGSLETAEELSEVAYDVGVQLGLGHLRDVGGSFQQMVLVNVRERLSEMEEELLAVSAILADEVVEAWEAFVRASAEPST